jgi:SPP1 family predicted phage head-tail adaptor
MGLPAGALRELVAIERPVEVRNELGESVQTWEHFARRRAHIEAISYTEQQQRQQLGGSVSHLVRIRYLEGLTGNMSVRWITRGGRLLHITGVVEKNNREEHEVSCEEQVT